MSKLYDLREALKAAIIAAEIGWTDDTILIKRQGSFWNDIATAINTAKHGAVLHIGVARGKRTDDGSLEYELTIPLTIICEPQVNEDATPEEDLWEALMNTVDDLRLDNDAFAFRMVAGDFQDIDIEADGGTAYLGRETIFTRKLCI